MANVLTAPKIEHLLTTDGFQMIHTQGVVREATSLDDAELPPVPTGFVRTAIHREIHTNGRLVWWTDDRELSQLKAWREQR